MDKEKSIEALRLFADVLSDGAFEHKEYPNISGILPGLPSLSFQYGHSGIYVSVSDIIRANNHK